LWNNHLESTLKSMLQNYQFAFHHTHLSKTKIPKAERSKQVAFMFFERPLATMTQSNVTGFVHIFLSPREVSLCFPQALIEIRKGLTRPFAIHIK
jgi:hypothetical protein